LKYELGICLYTLGISADQHSNFQEAIQLLEEALHWIADSRYVDITAGCYLWLGDTYLSIGENDKAKKCFDEALKLSKQAGVGILVPYSLDKLGLWADTTGNFKQGMQYHQEALHSFRILGVQSGQAYSLSRMAVSALELGEFAVALQCAQEGYECFMAIGHRWGIAISLGRIGYVEIALENYAEAWEHFLQALKSAQENHMPGPSIYALIGLAILEARRGESEEAVEILTFAVNHPITSFSYKPIAEKEMALLKTKLGEDRYSAAQMRGRALEFQSLMDKFNQL
jgi:tetratricopeptide (TPR) repeat protein